MKFDSTLVSNGILPDFAVYPNPTQDYLFLQSPEMVKRYYYTVSDISGKTILVGKWSQNSFGPSKIDMSSLQKGLYFVKLSGDRMNRVVKVVKD